MPIASLKTGGFRISPKRPLLWDERLYFSLFLGLPQHTDDLLLGEPISTQDKSSFPSILIGGLTFMLDLIREGSFMLLPVAGPAAFDRGPGPN